MTDVIQPFLATVRERSSDDDWLMEKRNHHLQLSDEDLVAILAAATEAPWFVHDFSDPSINEGAPTACSVTVSCDHPAHITVARMGGGLHGPFAIGQAQADAKLISLAVDAVKDVLLLRKRVRDLVVLCNNLEAQLYDLAYQLDLREPVDGR